MLALTAGDGEENQVYFGFTMCDEMRRNIEPAGKPFEEWIVKRINLLSGNVRKGSLLDEMMENNVEDEIIEEDTEEYEWEKEYKEQSKKNVMIFGEGKDNLYEIMELEDLFLNATVDDIRRQYKKLALVYHPDKNQDNNNENTTLTVDQSVDDDSSGMINVDTKILTEEERKKIEINKKWLRIKEAYETLLDPEKKKKYDSTFQFDDTIPDEYDKKDEKSFFREFGPVFLKNSIWSKRKPIPKIGDMNTPLEKVRKFYRFWFNFDSWRDFSVEGEYNLDEAGSRYEKRAMLKENKKMKSSMVKEEKARLAKLVNLAYKNDPRIIMEEEKIKAEKEKLRQERLVQRQKEKEEEEERVRQMKKQYEENLKKQQEMLVKERENLINTIISLAGELGITLSRDDVFQISLNAKIDSLKAILNEVQNKTDKAQKISTYKSMTKSYYSVKYADDDNATISASNIWKREEINALQKAFKKFPAGTKERWEKIAEIVKTKSSNQIIQMAHFLTTNPGIKLDTDIDLNQLLNKKTEKKVEPVKPQTESNTTNNLSTNISTSSTTQEDVWSEDQQKALEAALKKFPSSLPANERWTNIGNEVPGKTKKQCVDRYKYLSSLIKKK